MTGKGQEKETAEKGVIFSDVLPSAGFNKGDHSSFRIVFPDEYAAEVSTEKIASGKAELLIKDPAADSSETLRLSVFSDSDSKEQVKYVIRIKQEK